MKEVAKKVKLLEPIDIDKIGIEKDHYFLNAYLIDLSLDSAPDHIWQDIFEREWKSSRHLWDRKLFVIGDKLRLVTPANSMKEKLDWVKEVIKRTNKGIDKSNREEKARLAQTEGQMDRQAMEEKANIDMIRETLRKRFGAF